MDKTTYFLQLLFNDKNFIGTTSMAEDKSKELRPHWFSKNESKKWGEKFFLYYSIFWIAIFAFVVASKMYMVSQLFEILIVQDFLDIEYLALGFIVSLPAFFYPLLFPGEVNSWIS